MALSFRASLGARCLVGTPSLFSASIAAVQRRHLNVHEYVSMGLMREYDVPVPRSAVATTPDEAEHAYSAKLGGGGTHFTHALHLLACGYMPTVLVGAVSWLQTRPMW